MILATHGIVASQIASFVGLLDTYTGAAAAYSLRLLRTAYTGSAIRVRRASDNSEQDIGFSNNELDTTSLTSFCSGTDGFVTTWYDQSGNSNDATQSTAANQPQIVSGGSVITENGKPAMQLDGVNDWFDSSATGNWQTTIIVINNSDSPNFSSYEGLITGDTSSNTDIGIIGNQGTDDFYSVTSWYNNIYLNGANTGFNNVLSTLNNQTLLIAYNSSSIGVKTLRFFTDRNNFSRFWSGNPQEIVIYPSDQSSNRTGIETNINDFYTIY